MRFGILAIVSGLALSLSTAAFASGTDSATEQTVSATKASEKVVCRYVSHEGSLIPKRFCATQYAWDKRRRDEQQQLSEFQRRNLQMRQQ